MIEVSAENKRYYLGKDGVMERSGACLLDTSSFPLRKSVSRETFCQCVRPSWLVVHTVGPKPFCLLGT